MKKNGFTLVELLAVIIILAILYLFVMPKVTDLIKDGNKTDKYIIQNKIITAAKEYTSNYNTRFLNGFINVGYSKYISKEDLINNKLLDENEVESIGFFRVKVTLKEDNKLEYSISYDTETEKVILSVNLDGGLMISNPSGEYEVGSTIILNTPTKTNYEFSHWSIEVGNSILSGNMLTIGNINTTIKANWIKKVTLTIDLNGGTGNNQGGIYSTNTTITLKDPTKDNYVFAGWKLVSGNAVLSGNKLTLGLQDASVKALWVQETYEFAYTRSEQTFTAPLSGYYKLEAWGAQGGGYKNTGGYGGYSVGEVYLVKDETIYINVGGQGVYSSTEESLGGYNGGGNGNYQIDYKNKRYFSSGGGATHIATTSGLLSTLSSKVNNILIVAGGGGGGYVDTADSVNNIGGSAGGIQGGNGQQTATGYGTFGYGGTQISGGKSICNDLTCSSWSNRYNSNGSFGNGGSYNEYANGGGGGYYGGAGSIHVQSAGGGSGYIGNTLLTDKIMYCYNCVASSGTDTKTISTTCTNASATENCSKQGNGYVKISFIKDAVEDTRIVKNKEYDYIGKEEQFTIPQSGYYKFEIWGAQGGGYKNTGGYGGYSVGKVYLEKDETIYINVGGQGTYSSVENSLGGYNGGGNGYYQTDYKNKRYFSSGGGATHIATTSGLLSTLSSKVNNILIVAGGGGGGYVDTADSVNNIGGSAGGIQGGNGQQTATGYGTFGYGGTQTSGGKAICNDSTCSSWSIRANSDGSFGKGGSYNVTANGGGSGYYGGAGSIHVQSAGGGSGYIGNSLLTNKAMYCYNCVASSGTDTKTISTTCVNETAKEKCAKKGNGYAKITYLGE